MNEFRFSPRPNRAHEIGWQPWTSDAFERARSEDKPILLAISAVWCHWCHVMDETTYSDPGVIETINSTFVPIRVDNDRRPDINARYNQGGWPTTAFLDAQGSLIAGATYLPPGQMRPALDQIASFYRENRDAIAQRAQQLRRAVERPSAKTGGELRDSIVAHIVEELERIYDSEYGGFGEAPKFPMIEALEFLLQEYRVSQHERLYEMAATSMLGMSGGGMYDHIEGGFFRYSTTRDWTIPHFEKMTEDHAGFLRLLGQLIPTRNERFRSTLLSTLRYVREVLYNPSTSLFAGSQDADEEYYALPLEERRRREAPYVDRTSYSNWTAAMAGALMLCANALDDDAIGAMGTATLDALHDSLRDDRGLLYHFIEPQGAAQVSGLITDQAAYLRALLDAHEFAGEQRFFERAVRLCDAVEGYFSAPEGGFYDSAGFTVELGHLAVRDRPLAENASLAESFLRLHELTGAERYRQMAERTLASLAASYGRAGTFAAPFGRVLRRYLSDAVRVVLVGSAEATAQMREAAHALPAAFVSVRTIDPQDRAELEARGFDTQAPAAYVCRGSACAAPVRDAAQLRAAYDSF